MKILLLFALAIPLALPAQADPIELKTAAGTLYGTLERPKSQGPWPVALFLSGSGPTNRDGDNLFSGRESDCLRLLAEGLSARGIASVRYDKQGVAASILAGPREESDVRFDLYVDDAVAWGQSLSRDKGFSSLTVIGHSEGATIALAACTKLKTPAVSLAGPGRPAGQGYLDQLRPLLTPEQMAEATAIVQNLNAGKTTPSLSPAMASYFRPSVQPYLISLYRADPQQLIRTLPAPALIVQGTTDLQVKVEDARLLHKARPSAKLVLIEGMNHTLKHAQGDLSAQARAYSDPALPVEPRLIQEVARWIKSLPKSGKAASPQR